MTKVTVNAGACGFTTEVTVEKNEDGKLTIVFETDCGMVRKMQAEVAVLDRFTPLTGFQNNPVYLSAGRHLKHVACPVPSAILKALELEAGLNVAKDVTITFTRKK